MKFLKVKLPVDKLLIMMMISFIYMAFSADLNAQNVAITDDDGYTVNAAAMLDVKSINKGFLVPRVALVSTTDPVSVTKPKGLLVWNTSTSGTYDDPGFYYWSGSDWVKVGTSALDFQNGLTQAGNSVKLGGALTESSTITQGAYSLNFNLSGTGDFNIQDAGTSAFFVKENGNVGIGTISPDQKLEVNGNLKLGDNIMVEGSTNYRVYRNLVSYDASTTTGAIVINTNQPMNSYCMFRVKIEGYLYKPSGPIEIIIGAYVHGSGFSYQGHINVGSEKLNVRLAENSSTEKMAIILGDITTSFPYPKITVTEFCQGHNGRAESYADGWTITQETNISGYTPIEDVPDVTNMDNRYYTETEVDNLLSGENLWDGNSGKLYPHIITDNVGIGTADPGSRLEVYGNQSGSDNDPLFEVKNNDGQTIFAVYPEGVRIYVDEDQSKGLKGGFAVGGFNSSTKGITNDYLRITPDTFRIYIDDTGPNPGKGLKGGFAVGGFNSSSKGITNEYLRVTPDSVRIYVDNEPGSKGLKGGFAVGGFNPGKGYENAINFMDLTPENYFIGHESGTKTTPKAYSDSGKYNSFFGYQSGKDNATGFSNLFMGYQSGYSNIRGTNNVFLGIKAGYENVGVKNDQNKGCYNVFIGYLSGMKNTEGQSNVFIGNQTGQKNTLGRYNTFIGRSTAGQNTEGNFNTYIGAQAAEYKTGGNNNVFLGNKAGASNGNGSGNVFLGYKSGEDESGSNLLYIDNSDTPMPLIWGNFASGAEEVVIYGAFTPKGMVKSPSDRRYKKNVKPLTNVLDNLNLVNGVYFDWRLDEFPEMGNNRGRQIGVIAQDLEKVYPELVSTNTKGYKSVDYMKLTAILIEAVKEQQQVINELENENIQFGNEIQKINDLQNQIDRLRNAIEMNKQ